LSSDGIEVFGNNNCNIYKRRADHSLIIKITYTMYVTAIIKSEIVCCATSSECPGSLAREALGLYASPTVL